MNVRAIPKLGKGIQDGMEGSPFFERHQSRNVLNEHGSGLKLIDEPQVFPEKVVSRVAARTNGSVNRKSLARRSTSKQVELTDL
jgi:hypothetical protein